MVQRISALSSFVIATGIQYSVREFITWSARSLGIELEFRGKGIDEIAVVSSIEGDDAPAISVGDTLVRVNPRYFRPAEVETLLGDPTYAKNQLGWIPEISAKEMCAEMVASDLERARRIRLLRNHGHDAAVSTED